MGTITSGVGLISGINTGAIIDALMSLDSQPVTHLQTRIAQATAHKTAYSGLETQLQALQSIGMSLERPTTFAASTATSSDQSVLTATALPGATQGTYQLQVAQLVSSQQSISNGMTSASAPLQAGTITLEMGGGNLNVQTQLASLNGGAGIQRGQFRITDASGKSDVIDLSTALTLDDVVKRINTSLSASVQASIQGDHLVLHDTSGGTGAVTVQDLAGGTAAQDLGIAGTAANGTLTGADINYLSTNTALSTLNDGRGIRTASGTGDFTITAGDGSHVDVTLGTVQTVGDVINAINAAGNGKFKASLAPGAKGITLQDTSGGSGTFAVAADSGSQAAQDLGILKSTAGGGTISGDPLVASLDSVLVRSLNGGSGIALGQITVQNRAGHSTTIDLSGSTSAQDILDKINTTSGAGVRAGLNAAGTGIQIQDTSGGSGNLVIGDAGGGNTAESLGIAGTFGAATPVVDGSSLHLQWVSANTLLSNFNGGKGVSAGTFTVTSSTGTSATIDTTGLNTIGDVIQAINDKNIGIRASINTTGNGLLLTDTAHGAQQIVVQDTNGTTAHDLNIAGTGTGGTLDGAFEKTIQVNAGDTLTTLQSKIQALGFGVAASVISDGSAAAPFHLSLTAVNSGSAGRVLIDGGTTGLQFRNLVDGQDAAVFLGGQGAADPLLVTSHTNQLTGVIPGVTVSLQSASDKPVTLTVAPDSSSISAQLQKFTDTFNGIVDQLNTLTQFDSTTNQGGLLLGDGTAQMIQTEMYAVFDGVVSGAGQYRTIGDVGLSLGDKAKITFDANAFQAAYGQNPTAVKNLFTQATTGLGALIDHSMTQLADPVTGAITLETQTLDNQTQDYQKQITQLDAILANKRTLLQKQFSNMESVLAGLQSQQSALASLTTIAASSAAAAKTSTSSTSGSSSTTVA